MSKEQSATYGEAYRKKPVVIQAKQWNKHGDHPMVRQSTEYQPQYGVIRTLEDTDNGAHVVSPGDWIIRGVHGEFYACKPEIFYATYEAAYLKPSAPSERGQPAPEGTVLATEKGLTPVGRYIDLYQECCGTMPTLSNQECEVISRLVKETTPSARVCIGWIQEHKDGRKSFYEGDVDPRDIHDNGCPTYPVYK